MSTSASSLRLRARPATSAELDEIPWVRQLEPAGRQRAEAEIVVSEAMSGDYICRVGRPVTYWFGLIDGLLKMSNDDSQGPVITFTGVAPGGWFGEGTVLKREKYRYNIQALRKSVVAGLPVESFHWLLDNSIGFNRFVMRQLNERLGQFIAAREIDRLNNPDVRVADKFSHLDPFLRTAQCRGLKMRRPRTEPGPCVTDTKQSRLHGWVAGHLAGSVCRGLRRCWRLVRLARPPFEGRPGLGESGQSLMRWLIR